MALTGLTKGKTNKGILSSNAILLSTVTKLSTGKFGILLMQYGLINPQASILVHCKPGLTVTHAELYQISQKSISIQNIKKLYSMKHLSDRTRQLIFGIQRFGDDSHVHHHRFYQNLMLYLTNKLNTLNDFTSIYWREVV
jgi:hypothetical protein